MTLGEIIVWKYGDVADTVDQTILAWRHPTIPQPDEIQLEVDRQEYVAFKTSTLYQEKRKSEYPPVQDQLDAIWKILSDQGVKDSMLDAIAEVKDKYPKPNTEEKQK